MFKLRIMLASIVLLGLLACGTDTQSVAQVDSADSGDLALNDSAASYVLKGKLSDQAFFGGEVIALSSQGELIRAPISSAGAVNTSLASDNSYIVHFLAKPKALMLERENISSSGPPAILSFEEDPSGVLGEQLVLAAHSDSSEIDLGQIAIDNGLARSENNPLEQIDSDSDGIDDYADSDDDNDGIEDSATIETDIDETKLDVGLPFFVRDVWPKRFSLRETQNADIKVKFSHALKPEQPWGDLISLVDSKSETVEIAIETSDNGRRLKLDPKNPLQLGEKYFLKINQEVQSSQGESLAGDFSSWFKVGHGGESEKTLICHHNQHRKQDKNHSIRIAPEAVNAHLNHGDTLGACANDSAANRDQKRGNQDSADREDEKKDNDDSSDD